MQANSTPRPIEKNVVLLGAGNAHLVFVKRFGMRPVPGVAVTLVSEDGVIPYSAMVTGHIAGEYRLDEITVDLVRLCASVGVRFLAERVRSIDRVARKVRFAERPPLSYDVLSLGLGSLPACPPELTGDARSLTMRPMGPFIQKLVDLEGSLRREPRPCHFVVVGAGASGCELTLAIHKRLQGIPGLRMTLLQGNDRLLPHFPDRAARTFQRLFDEKGITVRVGVRVTGGEGGCLRLENGELLPFDAVLWATHAAPPGLLGDAGLVLNSGGFVQVRDTLQTVTDAGVFGTGDCVSFVSHPDLPRNGVHAVRQGAVLFDNVVEFLHERPLRPFRPQKFQLCLMNTCDGEAVFNYGALSVRGRWARSLKERIDRAWIDKYTHFAPMTVLHGTEVESPQMRCGGCGSKISSDVLSAVLKRLDLPDDSRILLGCRAGEDAAVFRMRPEQFGDDPSQLVEVQTVDFFKAFVDDPYLFGQIAVMHSVSDLYAMNARPFSALAIATLPYARGPVQEAQLFELLSGAVDAFKQLGMVLTGGHTTEGSELALGFSVTGHAEESRLFQKSKLQPGDHLVLTKPIGTGAILAAWMRGGCKAEWYAKLTRAMVQSNGPAAAIFAQAGVTACTDITGFGLAGHLLEMLDASHAMAELIPDRVPLHAGFTDVVASGVVSTLQRDNAKVSCRVQGPSRLPEWLFDPQTSGGLLSALRPEAVEGVIEQLVAVGYGASAMIGRIESVPDGEAPGIRLVPRHASANDECRSLPARMTNDEARMTKQ
ncbi:MAG: selenide, water dikinase SelD [Gemmataceae bacterium]|nr:selenide, water dikinase SelD [Gemmataceae bacterium]